MADRPMTWTWLTSGPEGQAALPSVLSRRRQRRLLHAARTTERDTYLWTRDHEAECSPQDCGYTPEPRP